MEDFTTVNLYPSQLPIVELMGENTQLQSNSKVFKVIATVACVCILIGFTAIICTTLSNNKNLEKNKEK